MATQNFDDPHRSASATVVVGVDDSKGALTALRWAADFADRRGRELRIVHGMGLVGPGLFGGAYAVTVADVIDGVRAGAREMIDRAEQIAHTIAPGLRTSTELAADSPAGLLIDRSADAYAVVLGATGSAGTFAHLGSTLLAVTAHAHGVVIVVRADADDEVHTSGPVVVGIDGGPVSEAAIATAFLEAAERRADLLAVHVWSDLDFGRFAGRSAVSSPDVVLGESEHAILAERLAGWQEKYPDVTVVRQTYASGPVARLQEMSKSAQLLVVGSHGRGGFTGMLLGSTANALVQHAHCPVMVVHPRAE
jgi:nucleotide-binding universal stress UspA family protein